VQIMEWLHEPNERVLAQLDAYFDPRRAPDPFVRALAGWVDLNRFLAQDAGVAAAPVSAGGGALLREWTAVAAALSRWRGTPHGLQLLLEVATGVSGFTILEHVDRDGAPRPFHLRVQAPQRAEPQRRLIEHILDLEQPAYMTRDAVEFLAERPSTAPPRDHAAPAAPALAGPFKE